MTTIDRKGLNAVVPAQAGTPLRIRVLIMVGKARKKGVWLTINRDDELSIELPETGKNLWLLERPSYGAPQAAKCLDLWARKINIHARRLAAYYESGDTESIKRLVNSI